jgi:asparagine synthase (glutamine-hydrolysing)
MRPQYLLMVGNGDAHWPQFIAGLAERTGLNVALLLPQIAALINEDCTCLRIGEGGCVVGTLFHPHGPAEPIGCLDPAESAAIISSQGDALLRGYWGGYVAAIATSGSVRVLRDPSATFPCYFTGGPECIALAADAELLVNSGLASAEIDWRELSRHFLGAGVPTPATALKDIREILAGFSLRFPGELDRQLPCWSAWDYVQEQDGGMDLRAARLSRTVRHCVSAWAHRRGRLLLSVSGGLDSSIVAACLSAARANIVCLTMFCEDPSGDERPFARALCNHLGLPLIERPYRIDQVDICAPLGAHLPRPKDRTQALAYECAHLEVAAETGADSFITGNGGDSVFGYSQSASALADRYLREGLGRDLLDTLRDVARQTGCSLCDAAASAWRITRGSRAYRCRPDLLFLDPAVIAGSSGTGIGHPWLDAPPDALPGKAAHIASILRVQQSFEPSRSQLLAVLNPLMSQPIIEACLEVPTWEWRSGGRDRSLARQAFAPDLPPVILRRRLKGGPSHFAAQILNHFREPIRERLLGGRLAREGLVDTSALEGALRSDHSCSSEERVRILEFVAAEAWLDSWVARSGIRSQPFQLPPF